jgi:hypothetical protein
MANASYAELNGGQRYACPHRKEHFGSWWVRFYKCNYSAFSDSAFSGYHFTPSDYSEAVCDACGGRRWRTKAAYVEQLPFRSSVFTSRQPSG